MAAFVTDIYRNSYLQSDLRPTCVVRLEMEKYLKPLILYKKKRYVGIAYEGAGKAGKRMVRGLELVRRDATPLVKSCQSDVFDALLYKESASLAVECVETSLEAILAIEPGGPFTNIIQSKSLRAEYVNPDGMVHVKVAELMQKRDQGSAPRTGDRVEYIVVASESTRIVDKAEDVTHAHLHNLAPDWYFYVEALEKTILRTLDVPLRHIDENLYERLVNCVKAYKVQALEKRKKHSKVRHGLKWIDGHACKSGLPQRKLTPYFQGVSVSTKPLEESADARASEELSLTTTALLQVKKPCGGADVAPTPSAAASTRSKTTPSNCTPTSLFVDSRTKTTNSKRGAMEQMTTKAKASRQTLL